MDQSVGKGKIRVNYQIEEMDEEENRIASVLELDNNIFGFLYFLFKLKTSQTPTNNTGLGLIAFEVCHLLSHSILGH